MIEELKTWYKHCTSIYFQVGICTRRNCPSTLCISLYPLMIIALAACQIISYTGDLMPTSSSNDRTALGIVWSCLTTIFACVWIAIHPNLLFKGEQPFTRCLMIFTFMLVAPELIVLWAVQQWWSSHRLASQYESASNYSDRSCSCF